MINSFVVFLLSVKTLVSVPF